MRRTLVIFLVLALCACGTAEAETQALSPAALQKDKTFFRQEFDLTDGSYGPDTTAESLRETVFPKNNTSVRNKITAFGVIKIIMNEDTGLPYEYFFHPVLDKTEPSTINRNRDGLDVGCDIVVFDDIPETERPKHGDVVKLTGIWRYDRDPHKRLYTFFVQSVNVIGESTW